jgi:hypothetical protein
MGCGSFVVLKRKWFFFHCLDGFVWVVMGNALLALLMLGMRTAIWNGLAMSP